jgi:hypothetical protein
MPEIRRFDSYDSRPAPNDVQCIQFSRLTENSQNRKVGTVITSWVNTQGCPLLRWDGFALTASGLRAIEI